MSYIQRRQLSGNMRDRLKKPANIPNRMAVPKTKSDQTSNAQRWKHKNQDQATSIIRCGQN